MTQTLRLIAGDPHLRLACLLLVVIGAAVSSVIPFQSLIAVDILGMSDTAYAAVLVGEALLGVASAVWGGLLSDSWLDRRHLAIGATALAVCGTALMLAVPSIPAFVVTHAILYPMSGVVFSQTFALTRLASEEMAPDARDAVLVAVRAFLAVPFVIVLPIWSVAMAAGAPLLSVYPVVMALHLMLLALVCLSWPSDRTAGWRTGKSRLSLVAGLRELGEPRIVSRVLIMGAIVSGQPIYMAVLGLIFADNAATALFFGLVAGLEIPVMLWMGALLARYPRRQLIAGGAVLYGSALALVPALLGSWTVWLLVVPAALGGGVILSLPLAYLQDLLAARPGAGGSLIAVQRVISQGIAAAVFAIGTTIAGYGLAAALAGLGMIGAAALYLWVDREGRPQL